MKNYSEERKKQTDKTKFDKNVIRELLLEGPRSTRQIKETLPISSSVLKNRLDEMIKAGEMESFLDPNDRRTPLYRLKNQKETESELSKHEMVSFMGDTFVQARWPEKWIEEALRENIEKAYKKKLKLGEKLTMSKEERFFYETIREDSVREKTSETNLTIFHKGLLPFQINQNMMKVTLQLMLDFFIDLISARKDEEMPIMMVLSYLPKVPRVRKKDEVLKETFEFFVSWAKLFKGIDVKSISEEREKELRDEYLQKYDEYYETMHRRFTAEG